MEKETYAILENLGGSVLRAYRYSIEYWRAYTHVTDITIPAEFHVYPDENIFRWKLNWNIDGFSNLFGKCVLFVTKRR